MDENKNNPTLEDMQKAYRSGELDDTFESKQTWIKNWKEKKAVEVIKGVVCVEPYYPSEDKPESMTKLLLEEEEQLKRVNEFESSIATKIIESYTDKIDLAKKFIKILPLYYDEAQIWWLWDYERSCWKMIDEIDILNWINIKSRADIITSKERTEILNSLKQVSRMNKPKEPKKSWIQFGKEIIDLETGNRFPASSEYFIVNPIPWKLGSHEDTPILDKLFTEWVGESWKETLYEILAYCLLADYPIERIFCLIGSGSNGKSCFLAILRNFIGMRNICSTDLNLLVHSRFEAARLFKKLVCQMGETNFDQMNNTQLIKRLVSGKDVIPMEMKSKTPFDCINYAKLIIATNNLPSTDDKSEGWYRKWLIVDFPNKFTEQRDILCEITKEEYENLAVKCVGVLMNLMKKRAFTNEGSIEMRMKRYEEKSNPLDNFIKEFTVENPNGDIWKFEFEKRLTGWCKEKGHRIISDVAIGKKMKDKGIQQQTKTAGWLKDGAGGQLRAWVGLSWKDNLQDIQDIQETSIQKLRMENELELPVYSVNPVKKEDIINITNIKNIKSIYLKSKEEEISKSEAIKSEQTKTLKAAGYSDIEIEQMLR